MKIISRNKEKNKEPAWNKDDDEASLGTRDAAD